MQTSGTFPGLSDGVRKTVTTTPPARRVVPAAPKPIAVTAPAPASTHRAGGHAKHTRRSK